MITVHHLEHSRSQRILWLLEELEVPYELQIYQRDKETMLAPDALKVIHPLGKSPVITDDGLVVAESGAIVEYVVSRYGAGRLIPAAETPERLRYVYWLHYAEGSAMTPLILKLIFSAMPDRAPGLVRPIVRAIATRVETGFVDPQLALHVSYWESELSKGTWFCGDGFSAADIQMSFPLEAAGSRPGVIDASPHIRAFLDRIRARPAYQKALERGGPYAYAGA